MMPSILKTDTCDRVRQIIADEFGLSLKDVKPDSGIRTLSVDSLELASLITELEDAFQMEVPDDDFQQFGQVKDIANYIDHTRSQTN